MFPTNKGNLYFEEVIGLVQQYMDELGVKRRIKHFYYKKSNTGEESMDSINFNKSVGSNDIVFCSSFLSVGVDICDKYDFRVYFSELWISQDIEQFANRIRNNNLFIKLYLPKRDSADYQINYLNVEPLDLGFSKEDLILIQDFIRTCNDMLDRNNEEYKYNPLIQSLLSANRYLKYDENDCKYYIDETAYKLKVFEERYTNYAKQLKVLVQGMVDFGYTIEEINSSKELTDDSKLQIDEYLKSCKRVRENFITDETFKFLEHITDDNIDLYKEIMKGNYEIFRSDKYEATRGENNLYVENIEILEKNAPIVISLYKNFTLDVINEIYEFCVDKKRNRINYTKLDKIRAFVSLENKRKQKKIDMPVLKFLQDTKVWVEDHPDTTKEEIESFQKHYAVKYANSVKNVVVEDVIYLEEIYGFIKDLWNVVVVQSRPKQGAIKIEMFDLLWETKNDINLLNIYGNKATQSFFADILLDNMNPSEEEAADELEHTEKKTLADVEQDLPNIVHSQYDYFKYSDLDGSNNRFLRKQENTQSQAFTPNETQEAINTYLENNELLLPF